jgi:hypothetical protein
MVGAVGYTSIGERDQETTRDAVGGDLREFMNALLQARHPPVDRVHRDEARSRPGRLRRAPIRSSTAVARHPRRGADENVHPGDHTVHYEAGFNYYIEKHEAKLSAAYGLFDPARGKTRHEMILAAQVSF